MDVSGGRAPRSPLFGNGPKGGRSRRQAQRACGRRQAALLPVLLGLSWFSRRRQRRKRSLPQHSAAQLCVRHVQVPLDRKSTRLNSSHVAISYAVFCLKKKKKTTYTKIP